LEWEKGKAAGWLWKGESEEGKDKEEEENGGRIVLRRKKMGKMDGNRVIVLR
jgi:hypothetical protein